MNNPLEELDNLFFPFDEYCEPSCDDECSKKEKCSKKEECCKKEISYCTCSLPQKIENYAGGKKFYFCKKCKQEIKDE